MLGGMVGGVKEVEEQVFRWKEGKHVWALICHPTPSRVAITVSYN